MNRQWLVGLLLMTCGLAPAQAIEVFACEPEWAALAHELGGERVEVFSATTGLQDPHHIEARPSLIAKLRRADLLVCTGAELEAGWLPLLLRQARNGRLLTGRPGYLEMAGVVTLKEVPGSLDRAQGDVHAAGNPHIHTDPRHLLPAAQALRDRLIAVDAAGAAHYQARHADFSARWTRALQAWSARAAPLRGVAIVTQHRGWVYLQDWLGLVEVATLEPKPGVPASSGHLAEVLATLRKTPARMVIRAAYQDDRASVWLIQQTGLPAVELPYTVGGNAQVNDLFSLYEDTLSRLLGVVQ